LTKLSAIRFLFLEFILSLDHDFSIQLKFNFFEVTRNTVQDLFLLCQSGALPHVS